MAKKKLNRFAKKFETWAWLMWLLLLLATLWALHSHKSLISEVHGQESALEAGLLVYGSNSSSLIAHNSIYSLEIDLREAIIQKATSYEVKPKLALDLAEIESQLNPNAKNPNSTAKGIYQFIDSTWESTCEGDVLNYGDNIDCALRLLGKDIRNIKHWTADKNTQAKLVARGWVF